MLSWIRQTALGLKFLHKKKVVLKALLAAAITSLQRIHRDIAPANLLLNAPLKALTIADFCLCKLFERDQTHTEPCGRHVYMAPEMRNCSHDGEHAKDPSKADIYSLAMCCAFALTNTEANVPIVNNFPTVLQREKVSGTDYKTFDAFIRAATNVDPAQRPSADQSAEVLLLWQNGHFLRETLLTNCHVCYSSATEAYVRKIEQNSRRQLQPTTPDVPGELRTRFSSPTSSVSPLTPARPSECRLQLYKRQLPL